MDANVLFSFFKKDSATRRLLRTLTILGTRLISPDFVLEELVRDKERVKQYAGIDEIEFLFLLSLLEKRVEVFSKSEYEKFLTEAEGLLPGHLKDVPYFALALKLNCTIWSNEKRLKKQDKVKVFSTRELLESFKL